MFVIYLDSEIFFFFFFFWVEILVSYQLMEKISLSNDRILYKRKKWKKHMEAQ